MVKLDLIIKRFFLRFAQMMNKNSYRLWIISLFFLGIFVFPNAVREVHIAEHHETDHCLAKDTQHFHEKEHQCNLCDFHFDIFENDELKAVSVLNLSPSSKPFVKISLYLELRFIYFQHRGPPALS